MKIGKRDGNPEQANPLPSGLCGIFPAL